MNYTLSFIKSDQVIPKKQIMDQIKKTVIFIVMMKLKVHII